MSNNDVIPPDKPAGAPGSTPAPGAAAAAVAGAATRAPGAPAPANRKGLRAHVTRLAVWFFCSFLLALMPPGLNALKAILLSSDSATTQPITMQFFMRAATGQGEFQLIAAALTAGIIGEMFGITDSTLKLVGAVIGAAALVVFAVCLFSFPLAGELTLRVPRISLLLLIGAAVISAIGVWVASMDRQLHG
jgi:hypothetical protein